MANITWTKVSTEDFIYGGCAVQGICCLGNGRLIYGIEEVGKTIPSDPFNTYNVARIIGSADNGMSWTRGVEIVSFYSGPAGRLRTTGFNTALYGFGGSNTDAYETNDAVIARTTTGGASWASAVTMADFAAIQAAGTGWQLLDFAVTDLGVVLALGEWFGNPQPFPCYITSTDGGATFKNVRDMGFTLGAIHSGAYLGNGIIIVGPSTIVPNTVNRLLRSTDVGNTWTPVTLPGQANKGIIHGLCNVGPIESGRAVAVYENTPVLPQPKIAYSSDFGTTWTASTLGTPFTAGHGMIDVVAPSPEFVVAVGECVAADVATGNTPFRFSEDGGITFNNIGTLATPLTGGGRNYTCVQAAIADDGAVLVAFTLSGALIGGVEVWRGVIDGFTGPGPCTTMATSSVTIGKQLQSDAERIVGMYVL